MFASRVLQRQQASISTVAAVTVTGLIAYGLYSYSTKPADSERGKPAMAFRGMGLTSLRLHSIQTLNHQTKLLRFEFPEPNTQSGLSLTSAVLTFSKPQGRVLPVIRPYTPVNNLDEPGYIELAVKRYPNGKQSTHLHAMTPGDSLYFLGAIKGYPWTPNKHSHITLIAGGAGITPMYQLIRGILKNPEDKTKITLVFGVNSDQDILFQENFAKYEKEFPNRFKAIYTVSNPAEGSPYPKGYVTKELLQKAMIDPGEKDSKVFVCGPPAMENAILGAKGSSGNTQAGILEQLGYTKDQIHKF
ncbi:NADH-cytochrome b5 reductase [Venustampulla echinocandica]|uniref:NADH-cytochrome b5 reductase n=1 Tax=Venustampulla echinocandica TaxID=2656787 RepID=A0A370TXX5_9HELO|nr:NADH-cytochrome b5 reductase [Venustampulla echinocandica]RDL40358.1 NADH-cytochrome b5 reductase [Venustampulla echinocandica]